VRIFIFSYYRLLHASPTRFKSLAHVTKISINPRLHLLYHLFYTSDTLATSALSWPTQESFSYTPRTSRNAYTDQTYSCHGVRPITQYNAWAKERIDVKRRKRSCIVFDRSNICNFHLTIRCVLMNLIS
jgi:hypothetical protein